MSASAVPPGTCVTHGWHGMTMCPRCSSSAGPFTPLAPAVTVDARTVTDLETTALKGLSLNVTKAMHDEADTTRSPTDQGDVT
jgi:hypothetical protein